MSKDEIINGCRIGSWVEKNGTEHFEGGEYILIDGQPVLRTSVKPAPPANARSGDSNAQFPNLLMFETDLVRTPRK